MTPAARTMLKLTAWLLGIGAALSMLTGYTDASTGTAIWYTTIILTALLAAATLLTWAVEALTKGATTR